jgi:predicted small lipoprotein YifL
MRAAAILRALLVAVGCGRKGPPRLSEQRAGRR